MTELRVHDFSMSLDGYAAGLVVPVLLGGGERLFENLGAAPGGWRCVEFAPSASVTLVRFRHGRAVFDTMGP
jgi:hypothetical protein